MKDWQDILYDECTEEEIQQNPLLNPTKMKPTYTIEATPNYSKRTFTIRMKEDGTTYAKYRTLPMSKQEFEETEANTTQRDWEWFLRSQEGSYYRI